MIKIKVAIDGDMIPYDEMVEKLIKKFEDNRLELAHSGLGMKDRYPKGYSDQAAIARADKVGEQ